MGLKLLYHSFKLKSKDFDESLLKNGRLALIQFPKPLFVLFREKHLKNG